MRRTQGGSLEACSEHAGDAGLVKAVLAMGMYPMFGRCLAQAELPPNASATAVTVAGEKVRRVT